MKVRESDYRTSQKYQIEKCRKITMNLVKSRDADILAWLDSQENKQGYLKDLIRADMERSGFRMTEEPEEHEKI